MTQICYQSRSPSSQPICFEGEAKPVEPPSHQAFDAKSILRNTQLLSNGVVDLIVRDSKGQILHVTSPNEPRLEHLSGLIRKTDSHPRLTIDGMSVEVLDVDSGASSLEEAREEIKERFVGITLTLFRLEPKPDLSLSIFDENAVKAYCHEALTWHYDLENESYDPISLTEILYSSYKSSPEGKKNPLLSLYTFCNFPDEKLKIYVDVEK